MTLITHRQRQLYEMAELQRSQSDQGAEISNAHAENMSHRSRASSVISTGTKFSISTMPPGHFHIDGVLEGSNRRGTATRPTSLYSVRSMVPSLPPYEGHQPPDSTFSNAFHHGNQGTQETSNGRHHHLEQPLTPTDQENALSLHYGRIVRTIDENHARQLARLREDHERELSMTRNAIDEAYRKEFKAKNREIERIREEAANEIENIRRESAADVAAAQEEVETISSDHDLAVSRIQQENAERMVVLHEEHSAAIEKAKHAIEDLWEGRWHDRTKVANEEADRRDAKRDGEWLRVIETMHPEFMKGIKRGMKIP